MFALYRGLFRHWMECASCLEGIHSHSCAKQAGIKNFSSHQLSSFNCLQSITPRSSVASIDIFCCYFNSYLHLYECFPRLRRARCTRLSSDSHPYSVHRKITSVNQYLNFFILSPGNVWNPLLDSILLHFCDLNSFKRGAIKAPPKIQLTTLLDTLLCILCEPSVVGEYFFFFADIFF